MNVIRRPARVAIVAATPIAPTRVVPKLTPAEERERLVGWRNLRGQVAREFQLAQRMLRDGAR